MDNIYVKEVIISNLKRRGNGKDDPIRAVLQVFEKDGTLICENDPYLNDKLGFDDIVAQENHIKALTTQVALLNNARSSQYNITKAIEKSMWEFKSLILNK
jgi:hypothetical protein